MALRIKIAASRSLVHVLIWFSREAMASGTLADHPYLARAYSVRSEFFAVLIGRTTTCLI